MIQSQPIVVTTQGVKARELLAYYQQALIVGAASRGLFVRLEGDWVLFLSFESFHGPLTLNLPGGKTALRSVEVNDRIVIQAEKILLPSTGIEIDLSRAETWETPPRPAALLSLSDRLGTLKTIATYILSQRTEPGLYFVLKDILDIELDDLPLPPRPFEGAAFVRLLQLLKTSNLDAISSALIPLLGSGAGLTPAGDDLILGLLLAYRRWGSALKPAFDLVEMNVLLNKAASQMTTLISANLISCASQGQADERLIHALDGIMTGSSSPQHCAHALLGWGSSSGRDALVGMALAVLSTSA